jgi:type IV pilus assembly protein PilW
MNIRLPQSHRARGFTLIELMVAMVLSLFVVGGLVTLVQAMKRSSVNQSGLSQLQDNERMAMTLITDVIQSTGYFPNPVLNTAAGSFPVSAPFTAAGQAIVGTGAFATTSAGGQTITVRYLTSGTDNVINCTGNGATAAKTFVNTFDVDANGNLRCTLTVSGVAQAPIALINGIKSMQVQYGVVSNPSSGNNSVDSYMDAAAVTAGGYWASVRTVRVTLNFVNPLVTGSGALQAGQTNATIPFTRVIAIMNKV